LEKIVASAHDNMRL